VLDVYQVSKKAVESCRNGAGPIFLECHTYRLRGHVGPDDNIQGTHTDIRPKEELDEWRKKDPILLFEKYLLDSNLFNKSDIKEIRRQIEREVEEAHLFARNSDYPEERNLGKYVFKK
jgi:TPP-dependent pyruvate/acetoin dehydrogenase alpha subunit